jgi:competence protein ComEC
VAGRFAVILWPLAQVQAARGRLFPWVPVGIGLGVWVWFGLASEPGFAAYVAAALMAALSSMLWARGPDLYQALAILALCAAAGFLAAGVRAHLIASPMLDFRYYGPVQGRIVEIDKSQSDAVRLTLDRVVLDRTSPERTPVRVRVSLHGEQRWLVPEPGQVVLMTAHLSAPEGAVEPGGFDFRRMAFFDQLGAVGYTRSPVLLWAEPVAGTQRINRLRAWLSGAMQRAVPGDAGAFAAGVMTGDRSGLSQQAVTDLRDSSLAHLLAISGMNMAFLVAFVFALLRYGLALVPALALRVNTKKLAAAVSFGVALFYLMLSGSNVATERAFLMVCVMLGAVLLDRKALTLRSVALAGIILLLWQPEALLEPGFQMSFAATVALIAGFDALARVMPHGSATRWVMPAVTLVLSSAIGGIATAPYAAAHFNRFADYGFVANLLTVPVMGALVMPAGAVAALLAPFGLAAPALWVMAQGSAWILFVAHQVAQIDGAVTAIPAPGPHVLLLITLGMAFVVLWPGRARLAGFLPVAVALALWGQTARPVLLISPGALAGLVGPEGRALSAPKGEGFAATSWLENDGDLADQGRAAARPGFSGPDAARRFQIGRLRGVVLRGKGGPALVGDVCATADLVILSEAAEMVPSGCRVIDADTLKKTGTLAVYDTEDGLVLVATHAQHRIWSAAGAGQAVLPRFP